MPTKNHLIGNVIIRHPIISHFKSMALYHFKGFRKEQLTRVKYRLSSAADVMDEHKDSWQHLLRYFSEVYKTSIDRFWPPLSFLITPDLGFTQKELSLCHLGFFEFIQCSPHRLDMTHTLLATLVGPKIDREPNMMAFFSKGAGTEFFRNYFLLPL